MTVNPATKLCLWPRHSEISAHINGDAYVFKLKKVDARVPELVQSRIQMNLNHLITIHRTCSSSLNRKISVAAQSAIGLRENHLRFFKKQVGLYSILELLPLIKIKKHSLLVLLDHACQIDVQLTEERLKEVLPEAFQHSKILAVFGKNFLKNDLGKARIYFEKALKNSKSPKWINRLLLKEVAELDKELYKSLKNAYLQLPYDHSSPYIRDASEYLLNQSLITEPLFDESRDQITLESIIVELISLLEKAPNHEEKILSFILCLFEHYNITYPVKPRLEAFVLAVQKLANYISPTKLYWCIHDKSLAFRLMLPSWKMCIENLDSHSITRVQLADELLEKSSYECSDTFEEVLEIRTSHLSQTEKKEFYEILTNQFISTMVRNLSPIDSYPNRMNLNVLPRYIAFFLKNGDRGYAKEILIKTLRTFRSKNQVNIEVFILLCKSILIFSTKKAIAFMKEYEYSYSIGDVLFAIYADQFVSDALNLRDI